jgi:ADP-ribose pyrophosphatase
MPAPQDPAQSGRVILSSFPGHDVRKPQSSSELIFQGKVFSVRRHLSKEPGGVTVPREIVHHNGAAVIVPVFDDGGILLVRQFRFAAGSLTWELPAGTIEPGDKPLPTARRELAEETGYQARRWRKLVEFYPSPGFVTEKMTLFIARDLRRGPTAMEADERITTRKFSMPELLRLIQQNKIKDAKTIAGVLFFERWGVRPPPA